MPEQDREAYLADPMKNFDGVVWFRRSFEIPAEWIGKPLKLNLGEGVRAGHQFH